MDEDRLSGYVSASSRARSTFKLTYCVHDQICPDSNVQELCGDPSDRGKRMKDLAPTRAQAEVETVSE